MNAIITGATKGIGRATTLFFAALGCNLAICARSTKDLEDLKKELQNRHPHLQILTQAVDLSQKSQVFDFAAMVKEHWQQLDILINNAGLYSSGLILEEADENLEQMIALNVMSPYYLTRAVLPLMLPQQKGHIFNLCSIASKQPILYSGSYGISKYALLGFTLNLREELKDKGIRVTAVLPGATMSAAWEKGDMAVPEKMMKGEDIAKAIWGCYHLGDAAVVEEILIRPQWGDLP